MDTIKAIMSRRSIRKFTNQDVSENDLKILLEAAMQAPSAGNQQPWHFLVIKRRDILAEIQKFHPYSSMLSEASLAILICGDSLLEKYKNYWVIDCSNAAENLLLAAHSIGLGAVWLGIHPREERINPMKKLFSLTDNIFPHSLIAIGYPAETKKPEYRYKPERIHFDKW
jgi:nitroreductase